MALLCCYFICTFALTRVWGGGGGGEEKWGSEGDFPLVSLKWYLLNRYMHYFSYSCNEIYSDTQKLKKIEV